MYAGIGVFAVGLLIGLMMLVPAKPQAADRAPSRITRYTAPAGPTTPAGR